MGKGIGLFGNFRKKIGNTVGYTLKNSNNAQTQGVRVYQPVVSNPKSDGQSMQRMKLMPLQIFYQSFSDVLNHAFEGKRLGQMNRQRFMQLNMTATSGRAPAVQKGERILVPIKAQVSSGSLTINTALVSVNEQNIETVALAGLWDTDDYDFLEMTVKQFSELIISNNLGIEDGMEIAFLFIVARKNEDPRAGVPLKFYCVLNTADNLTTMSDLMGQVANYIDVTPGNVGLNFAPASEDISLLGASIIISKKNASGWSNNNARFYPTVLGESLFYDEKYYLAAVATYGPNGSTLASDLFLRQADNAAGTSDPNAVISTQELAIQVNDDFENPVLTSANAVIATLRSGVKAVVVNLAGNLVSADGTEIKVTYGAEDARVTSALSPAATQFSGLKEVVYGSF